MILALFNRLAGGLLIAFASLTLTRAVFALNLHSYFSGSFSELLSVFIYGMRFDAVSISFLLGPYFLFVPFLRSKKSERAAQWFFVIMLGAMNLLNCIDAEFFRFTARRSTEDLFKFAFLSDDLFHIAPNLISTFWYLLIAFILIMLVAAVVNRKLLLRTEDARKIPFPQSVVTTLLVVGLGVIGARGGLQPIPLTILDASKGNPGNLNAVALNTPFTILKTIGKPELPKYDFEGMEMANISPISTGGHAPFAYRKNNVVFLIVESFANEYIGSLNGDLPGYTPFLDSLSRHALVFPNAFANGHRSIEGIAAVASSIPTLMYEPYTTSRYAGNEVSSFASLLKEKGYFSAFMHGGNRNSMNFESFAEKAGFELFYDRNDYPYPDEHYDGYWGISDHYFLSQCVKEFSAFQQPFVSGVFTLSSHHPYSIPPSHRDRYPKGTLPIHESIGYADASLRQFFKKAAQTEWYEHTLFIITADHTSISENDRYQTRIGSLRIPIIFFQPSADMAGVDSSVIQQIDILPTALDLLQFEERFFSFGKSAFDTTTARAAVAFSHDQHQLTMNDTLATFDGERITGIFDIAQDTLLHRNLVNDASASDHLRYLRAFLNNYSVALHQNRMTREGWEREEP